MHSTPEIENEQFEDNIICSGGTLVFNLFNRVYKYKNSYSRINFDIVYNFKLASLAVRTPGVDNPPVIRPPPPRPPPPRPPPPPTVTVGDCSCTSYVTDNGYGNCEKDLRRKGVICYVNLPSTCKDLRQSKNYKHRKYSWEACRNGVAKRIPKIKQRIFDGNYT